MKSIIEKAIKTHSLSKDEIICLLENNDNYIFIAADKVRERYKGNSIHLRGLIEFTNICKRNCFYCGLRKDNKTIDRYRMNKNEIIECAYSAFKSGYKTIVLQGGEDEYLDTDKLCVLIKEIKKFDMAVTLSIGEKTYEEYKAYKSAGADRYLIRIETTDKKLYNQLHPNMDFENRINCIYNLKSLEYETGTGSLVGLPNQTIESLADDILFFKEINADMIGIGPFIPHPCTPLANKKTDNFYLALKVMAITRLLLPDINIPATTAMETLNKNGKIIALQSGANVIMPNITPVKYQNKYELYPNKTCENNIEHLKDEFTAIKRTIALTRGFRKD